MKASGMQKVCNDLSWTQFATKTSLFCQTMRTIGSDKINDLWPFSAVADYALSLFSSHMHVLSNWQIFSLT